MRQILAITGGKTILEVLRLARRGGTALPGLVAHRLDPHILTGMTARFPGGSALVTGTNGKTTTTRLFSSILSSAGLKTVNNRSGSNLIRGLTSTLLSQASFTGKLEADMGLFEVDEAVFPQATTEIMPRLVLMNNLFRDQLDRYGEIETIRQRWVAAIKKLQPGTFLVLNADDPSVAYLGKFAPEGVRVLYYGLDAPEQSREHLQHAVDASKCIVCATPLQYSAIYISHMGHYRCPNCDFARPVPHFTAREVRLEGTDGSAFVLEFEEQRLDLRVGVPGLYNVYNAIGAATACIALGIAPENIRRGLESFKAAFGRIERISLTQGRTLLLALVKNPVGFNEVLRMLLQSPGKLRLMALLNDLIADGRDVSWIWDVDFEILQDRVEWLYTGGIRAYDMALRLKYAGVTPALICAEEDISRALDEAIDRLKPNETLYITPTYTAMLQLREILQKKGLVVPFWEE
ncbi:MurT ligase domain-containing protein [Candidatus Chlorohelix sp.]|uniref:MurT ligase domain-containing protein n=1 Tax=Candidatus Chlorohelix sp. TaxID=3139201 RepID=UPI003044F3AC